MNSALYSDVSRIFTASGYLTWTQEIFSQIQFSFNFSSLWKMKQVQAMLWIQHKIQCVLRPLVLHVWKVQSLLWVWNCVQSDLQGTGRAVLSPAHILMSAQKADRWDFPINSGSRVIFLEGTMLFYECLLVFVFSFETVPSIESAIYSIPLEGTRGTTHHSQQDLSQRSSQGS